MISTKHPSTFISYKPSLVYYPVSVMHEVETKEDNLIMTDDYVERPPGYTLERIIGRGTFSECWLARHELTGCKVAIKKVPRSADLHMLEREVRIWLKLDHSNIIQLYEVIPLHNFTYLAMEYAGNGELFKFLAKRPTGLPYTEVLELFTQICQAVNYLHTRNVAHRDLKLENILLDEDYKVTKICDFGFAFLWRRGEACTEWLGSPEYSAPEVISNEPYDPIKADCWSLGVILFALLAGYLPFSGVEDDCDGAGDIEKKIKYRVTHGKYDIPEVVPDEIRPVIRGLLNYNVERRWDTNQLLSYPLFRSFSINPKEDFLNILERLTIAELKGIEQSNSKSCPNQALALKRILTRSKREYQHTSLLFNRAVQSSITSPEINEIQMERPNDGGWIKKLGFFHWPSIESKYKNVDGKSHSETSE